MRERQEVDAARRHCGAADAKKAPLADARSKALRALDLKVFPMEVGLWSLVRVGATAGLPVAGELQVSPRGRKRPEVVTSLTGRNLTIAPNQALEHNAYVCHATCGAGVAPAAVMAHL